MNADGFVRIFLNDRPHGILSDRNTVKRTDTAFEQFFVRGRDLLVPHTGGI